MKKSEKIHIISYHQTSNPLRNGTPSRYIAPAVEFKPPELISRCKTHSRNPNSKQSPGFSHDFLVDGIRMNSSSEKLPETSAVEKTNSKPLTKRQKIGKLYLLQSLFKTRPSTVLFDYPPQCLLPSRINERAKEAALHLTFRISEHVNTYNSVVNSMQFAGLTQTTSMDFNICVSSVPRPELLRELLPYQKINHFPGAWQLGRKDCMWKNYFNQKRRFGSAYDYCPQTYILPEDYGKLQGDREMNREMLWILKPVASSCGKGIKIISADSSLPKKKGCLVSRYISNPHTINGLKYDLRLYVCVTSYDPLKVYIYEDGLVRFATDSYSTNRDKLHKKYVHLTNFSVNKRSSRFVRNKNASVANQGNKWSFKALRQAYSEMGIDPNLVFKRIEDIIIKSLISVEPHVVNSCKLKSFCFETYGFDVLIDSDLRPWLLEVNVSPSLSSSSPLDKRIKTSLVCDVYTLIGIIPNDLASDCKATKSNNLTTLNKVNRLEEISLSENDLRIIADFEEEGFRSGRFKRIFPRKSNADIYAKYFPFLRYNNVLLKKFLQSGSDILNKYLERRFPSINV